MMKIKPIIFIQVWLFILITSGCKENDIILDFDNKSDIQKIELAGPLAKINITAIEWLNEDFAEEDFEVDQNGLISMKYTDEVFIQWESLVEIDDKAGNSNFPTVQINYQEKIKFNITNDVRIDSMYMEAGELRYRVEAPLGSAGTIIISIPELLTGRVPYTRVLTVTAGQRIFNITELLAGKKIHFSKEPNSSYITFNTSLNLTPVNPLALTNVQYSISNINTGLTFGYFGQKEIKRTDASLTFSLFSDLELINEIELADLSLEIIAKNKIGVPFKVKTDNIRVFRENDPVNFDYLMVNGVDNIQLNVPSGIYGNPIIAGTSKYTVSGSNSNILTIGNKYPDKLLCDITTQSNPNGEIGPNFMGNETRLQTDLVLKVPFWFKSGMYSRKDTVDFDFNDIIGSNKEDVEKIEFIDVYFDFYNKFPFGMVANAWVINNAGETIDVLFGGDKNVIKSGAPGTSGKITNAEYTKFVVNISNEQIKRYSNLNAKKIVLETKLTTFNNGQIFVKIYDKSELDAIISIITKTQLP